MKNQLIPIDYFRQAGEFSVPQRLRPGVWASAPRERRQIIDGIGRSPVEDAVIAPNSKRGPRVGVDSQKLIKIGAKVVSHGCYVTFQLAEVAVSRQMFAESCP
jgi:hypothetical protein